MSRLYSGRDVMSRENPPVLRPFSPALPGEVREALLPRATLLEFPVAQVVTALLMAQV
jgi:hypothetical protein